MATRRFSYNPETPIAVFLGPSLEPEPARALIDANFYPPAQMGDIYRLIASGVDVIVLLDGRFFGVAAVWQREILAALAAGIHVVGAASMGALRAAELHTYGMVGVGTVFSWYRDGVIDGDDEVAVAHAGSENQYRALSDPLVNIRYNLQRAVAAGELSREQADELVTRAKETNFWDRSYRGLMRQYLATGSSEQVGRALADRLTAAAMDVKRADAMLALECARDQITRASVPRATLPPASRFYRATSQRKRGFLHPGGYLVTGEMIWERLREDAALVHRYRMQTAKHFYLCELARDRQLVCPDDFLATVAARWRARHGIVDDPAWLRANGLIASEFHDLLRERATVTWMLTQESGWLDIDMPTSIDVAALWLSIASVGDAGEDDEGRVTPVEVSAAELAALTTWTHTRGITCPAQHADRFADALASVTELTQAARRRLSIDLSCCRWLLQRQPYHFGYTGWSPISAVLEELQITGRAAEIVARDS